MVAQHLTPGIIMHIYVPKTGGQRQNWRRMVIFGYTVSSKVSLSCSGKTISTLGTFHCTPALCMLHREMVWKQSPGA